MKLNEFKLERYFAEYEFKIEYLMSSSDCDGLYMSELLDLASPESLKLWNGLKINYTESAGHPILRKLVADITSKFTEDNVVIGVPEELIFVAMNTLLKPHDHLIVITPTYQSLYSIAKDIGCEVSSCDLEVVNGKWDLDLGKLEDMIRLNTKLLVINFPNNPTGFLPNRETFDRILMIAKHHRLYVFSDEMYRLLEYHPEDRLPVAAEVYEKAISLSGVSKSFALPGLRVGWLTTADPKLIKKFIAFKDFTTICNSAPSEILAIIALENTTQITERNRKIVDQNLTAAREFFQKHDRWFEWIEPNGGSICFPKWRGKKPIDAFCLELVEKHGLMIVPGNMFDSPLPNFRIGLGRKNFIPSLEIFDELMSSYTE